MGLIYKRVNLRGARARRMVSALFDTGASECFIRADLARKVGLPVRLTLPRRIELGKGSMKVTEQVEAVITINGHKLFWNYVLVPHLTEELILGSDFFQRWKITLVPETEEIRIDPKALKLKLI